MHNSISFQTVVYEGPSSQNFEIIYIPAAFVSNIKVSCDITQY